MYERTRTDIAQNYNQQNLANNGQRYVAAYVRSVHDQDANQVRRASNDGADDEQIWQAA